MSVLAFGSFERDVQFLYSTLEGSRGHYSFPTVLVLYRLVTSDSLWLFVTLCDPLDCIACQVPLSMVFFRQEYWSGLPFPIPRDLPDPEIEPASPCVDRWILYQWATRGSSIPFPGGLTVVLLSNFHKAGMCLFLELIFHLRFINRFSKSYGA